ncbi:hypothetical protein B2J93_3232 [Marssonina coronariae]|uniref:Uncharacterized protein n=1 Tax=Diplocarpon coronariae TaxID=2795749 RepID=A0A218Z411_9HELO|nr:hypothetical protein B2J93_3232 [Marssonina coronariae]
MSRGPGTGIGTPCPVDRREASPEPAAVDPRLTLSALQVRAGLDAGRSAVAGPEQMCAGNPGDGVSLVRALVVLVLVLVVQVVQVVLRVEEIQHPAGELE